MISCATLGSPGEAPEELPTTGVGPFRKLTPEEVRGLAPYVLEDSKHPYSDPAALQEGNTTVLYAASEGSIVRTTAPDQRTFGPPETVLTGNVTAPAPVRFKDGLLLFYGTPEGVALRGQLVLPNAKSPSVYVQNDRLRMLYSEGSEIKEAESSDGSSLTPLGSVLMSGRDPCASLRMTPAGRLQLRVLFTAVNEAGQTSIGFASRYGETGPLERNPTPAYELGASSPAFVEVGGRTFLYVQQLRTDAVTNTTFSAIAAAVSPSKALPSPTLTP